MRLIVHVHDYLVLALRDGHRRVDLARRVPRWLASRLFGRFMYAVVALSGESHCLRSIQRHTNVVLFVGCCSSVRVSDHEGREVIDFGSLISEAIVSSEAELTVRFLSCDLSLHGATAHHGISTLTQVPRARLVQAIFANTLSAATVRRDWIEHR